MIGTKKLWELCEIGWLMMRQNPGGKSAILQGCLLGFAGTINIADVLDSSQEAELKIKIGNEEVQTGTIEFGGCDPENLTPSDAVVVLNDAGFTGCVFSIDPETNRLMVKPSDPSVKWIQVYSDLAGALRFGNCRHNEGKGCYLWASFNGDLKGVAETEEWDEDVNIENDSPFGEKVTYTKPGARGGTQIVVTDRLASREAKQMLNGGLWIRGDSDKPDVYKPPVSSGDASRKVDILTFSKVFEKSRNTEGDEVIVRERLYIGGVGKMIKTGGAGGWSDSEYTVTFASYTGEDGKVHGSPVETDYTIPQWEALDLQAVFVADWENVKCSAS